MKKLVLTFLLAAPLAALGCAGYVIGFRGLNEAFDYDTFRAYSEHHGYCSRVYSWNQHTAALNFINQLDVKYRLYGYSRGAITVGQILGHTPRKKPEYVITLGAHWTADVNFDRYGVKYKNYFDDSGRGQKSPGVFLQVSHFEIQREVNKLKGIPG
jgi:hypothetical protein